MFQAIVHAPKLRPGARLCLSDLGQTVIQPPATLAPGARVAIRFGACCPSHAIGDIVDLGPRGAVLRSAGSRWRLLRSPDGGGIDIPGLMAEDWIVGDREDG